MTKQEILKALAEFFASKGNIMTAAEYRTHSDQPVSPVILKRKFGSWNRIRRLVENNYAELFDEVVLQNTAITVSKEIDRQREEKALVDKAEELAKSVKEYALREAEREFDETMEEARERAIEETRSETDAKFAIHEDKLAQVRAALTAAEGK